VWETDTEAPSRAMEALLIASTTIEELELLSVGRDFTAAQ